MEIYDHFERYKAELLGQCEWRSLPIDSKDRLELAPQGHVLKPGEELTETELGTVHVSYVWTPEADADDSRYAGSLEVKISRAEGRTSMGSGDFRVIYGRFVPFS